MLEKERARGEVKTFEKVSISLAGQRMRGARAGKGSIIHMLSVM